MTLAPGSRLGPYEVVAPLGAGGMGEVWRAKDTRLGHEVAIKVLPEHLSADPDLRARFEREARIVSAFNHPHICTLFGVGRGSGGLRAPDGAGPFHDAADRSKRGAAGRPDRRGLLLEPGRFARRQPGAVPGVEWDRESRGRNSRLRPGTRRGNAAHVQRGRRRDAGVVPGRPAFRVDEPAARGNSADLLRLAVPLADTLQRRGQPQLSPDGRWLAYTSGSPATAVQIYVQSMGGAPGRWQISNRQGTKARWTKGGRELIYQDMEGRLMSVAIDTKDGFRAGSPQPLFALPQKSSGPDAQFWTSLPTGETFVVFVPPVQTHDGMVDVVTDFSSLVNRK